MGHLFDKSIEKDGNKIDVKIRGGRQLENGLGVPAIYFMRGNNKKLAEIFFDDAKKSQKGKAAHMNIKQEADSFKISANMPYNAPKNLKRLSEIT